MKATQLLANYYAPAEAGAIIFKQNSPVKSGNDNDCHFVAERGNSQVIVGEFDRAINIYSPSNENAIH